MLETRALTRRFGGLVAVDGIDLAVARGEIRCIIGPNGAGKTTFFNLLTGEVRPTSGEILLEGQRIDGLPPHRIARLGVARKFQVPAVFAEMSVQDNLAVAADGTRPLPSLLRRDRTRDGDLEAVLSEIGLREQARTSAGRLAHGQVQRLEIGMVLVNQPRVLLLDEPTAGMTFEETRTTAELLRGIAHRRGLTMVLVEHDIEFIRMIGERVTVLHEGRVLMDGTHQDVAASPDVRRVYLGEPV